MLGAGVMGAQIAAHLVNVKVPVVLFDLPAKEGPKNGIVTKAVEGLKKLKPSPLGVPEDAALIQQANYEEHLALLARMRPGDRGDRRAHGLEAGPVQEDRAARRAARDRRVQHLGPVDHEAVRGAAGSDQAALLRHPLLQPAALHVPGGADRHADHEPQILDHLETFVTSGLGKGVVRAKDTPNFIANRVGIAGMLATMREAEKFGLTFDVVDDLTGKKLGRASPAAPSAPPTWWAWTRWRTSSRRCRTPCRRDRSVLRELRHAARC